MKFIRSSLSFLLMQLCGEELLAFVGLWMVILTMISRLTPERQAEDWLTLCKAGLYRMVSSSSRSVQDMTCSFQGECEEQLPPGNHPCPPGSSLDTAATNFCKKMLDSLGLHSCFSTLNPMPYYESCRWSYCEAAVPQSVKAAPNLENIAADFACHSVESYVRACRGEGMQPEIWRTSDFCRKAQQEFV